MERMNTLMKICNRFLLRRTSTVLKELLPTKVEQVGQWYAHGMTAADCWDFKPVGVLAV